MCRPMYSHTHTFTCMGTNYIPEPVRTWTHTNLRVRWRDDAGPVSYWMLYLLSPSVPKTLLRGAKSQHDGTCVVLACSESRFLTVYKKPLTLFCFKKRQRVKRPNWAQPKICQKSQVFASNSLDRRSRCYEQTAIERRPYYSQGYCISDFLVSVTECPTGQCEEGFIWLTV